MHLFPSNLSERFRRSLTLKTMAWLGFPVVGISFFAITSVYFYTLNSEETRIQQDLRRHLQDRSKQDSEIFQLAEANQKVLKQDLMERLVKFPESTQRFDQQMERWKDGTLRNFSQKQDLKTFPSLKKSTIFVGPQVQLTDKLKSQILTFETVTSQYGRAFFSRYDNTWINSSQNVSVDYRPNSLWGLEATSSTDVTQEEYGQLATPTRNPSRSPQWTPLYFDPVPARWMVSLVTPVDYEGKHIGSIGNDIVVNELMDVTIRDAFSNSRNVIFQKDGLLIVHPDRMEEIKASGGKLKLQSLDDPELKRIFDQTRSLNADPKSDPIHIVKDPKGQSFWAITKIKGPDWVWVTIYPQSDLVLKAIERTLPLIVFGLLGLLLELFLLYRALHYNVYRPLAKLTAATRAIARGDFEIELDTARSDELGSLARSFSSMVSQLQTSFSQLATYNETLESQVQDRTQELSTTLTDLQQTQTQLIQSEKMSSLGEMVAGIAHEVNNPIGFVHGNLEYAQAYVQQLLEHIALYHGGETVPDSIKDHADTIDLAFIQMDLPKLLASMKVGTDRIQEIVLSLRNFSRLDGVELRDSSLHEGLDSTLLILNHRLKRSPQKPIGVEKRYGQLPLVQCYPGLLNQVFMNLMGNAIDALETVEDAKIVITTRLLDQQVEVEIADNGSGIPASAMAQIFNSFFTTKEIGKGTGLGLSISHQIITERHQGTIVCRSSPQGTAFVITLPIDHPAL
jgi:two-component system, NtrC family, sensor kinase